MSRNSRIHAAGRTAAWSAGLVGALGIACAGREPTTRPRHNFTIAPETTVVTEPITPGGYPDFLAAMNARASQMSRPDDDAGADILAALGPDAVPEADREVVARWLGARPWEDAEDFVTFEEFLAPTLTPEEIEVRMGAAEDAGRVPWSTEDLPELAAWLDRVAPALDRIGRAAVRGSCFLPLVPDGPSEVGRLVPRSPLPYPRFRAAFDGLRARAMLRARGGDAARAMDDVLTCRRLARHLARGPDVSQIFFAAILLSMSVETTAAVWHHAPASDDIIRGHVERLGHLPALPSASERIDREVRLLELATVLAAHADVSLLDGDRIYAGYHPSRWLPLLGELWRWALRWDDILALAGARTDALRDVASRPALDERLRGVEDLVESWRHESTELGRAPGSRARFLIDPDHRTAVLGRRLVDIVLFGPQLMRGWSESAILESVVPVAAALEGYRRRHGVYPVAIDDVAADIGATEGAVCLEYHRTERGWRLAVDDEDSPLLGIEVEVPAPSRSDPVDGRAEPTGR